MGISEESERTPLVLSLDYGATKEQKQPPAITFSWSDISVRQRNKNTRDLSGRGVNTMSLYTICILYCIVYYYVLVNYNKVKNGRLYFSVQCWKIRIYFPVHLIN